MDHNDSVQLRLGVEVLRNIAFDVTLAFDLVVPETCGGDSLVDVGEVEAESAQRSEC